MPEIDPETANELRRLEQRLEALLLFCRTLQQENETLNALLTERVAERSVFVEQTAIAKNRVAAMISRLKSMGHES
jgi:cell division protein ZapB